MRRQHFFFLAFTISTVVSWVAFDQLAGTWFAGQIDGANTSRLFSLVVLKFGMVLTAGAIAVMPYVFLTVDVAKHLEQRAHAESNADFAAYVTIGLSTTVSRDYPTQGNLRRPPRALS